MRVLVLGSDPDYLVNFRSDLMRQVVAEGGEAIGASPGPADGPHADAVRALGARYEHVNMVRNRITPTTDLRAVRDLYALMRRVKPDALFAYTIKPVIYGCLAARWAGVPVISALVPGLGYAFEGAGLKNRTRAAVVARMYRAALARTQAVFFQNTDDREEFFRREIIRPGHPTVMLAGSGVNLSRFTPTPLSSKPVFLWVGRLLRDKGLGEFVQAAKLVRAVHPHAEFRVVGYHDGGPLDSCQKELEAAQAAGNVVFVGRVADIRPELGNCTAFVLPSYYREGIPRSGLEALAMGRPIITTDWIGCRELIRGRGDANGFLVPVRDASAVAEAARAIIEKPGLTESMARASRAYAEERFDVVQVNRRILDALGFVRNAKPGGGAATRATTGAPAATGATGPATMDEQPPCTHS